MGAGTGWVTVMISIFLGAPRQHTRLECWPRAAHDPADRPRLAGTREMRRGRAGAPRLPASLSDCRPPARTPGHGRYRGHPCHGPTSRTGAPAACMPGRFSHPTGVRLRRCAPAWPRSRLASPAARPARRTCSAAAASSYGFPLGFANGRPARRTCSAAALFRPRPLSAPARMRLDAPKTAAPARTCEGEPA